MSMIDKNDCKVGVLIGRFQSPILLEGHKEVIDKFLGMNFNDYLIILGVPATKATKNNPLDFDSRRRMIQEKYPRIQIMYLKDCNEDEIWSKQLDAMIQNFAGNRDAVIFGTADNVCSRYTGKYKASYLESTKFMNEDELRAYSGKRVLDCEAWRAGVVWATQNRYPTTYPTVDCAIFDDESFTKVWMARKPNETFYRFVGGFVDPSDYNFQEAAVREAKEETGLECKVVGWIGTYKIDDWRYRQEEDKIITTFFKMIRMKGSPKPDDDIEELKLIDLNDIPNDFQVMPEHQKMFDDICSIISNKILKDKLKFMNREMAFQNI